MPCVLDAILKIIERINVLIVQADAANLAKKRKKG